MAALDGMAIWTSVHLYTGRRLGISTCWNSSAGAANRRQMFEVMPWFVRTSTDEPNQTELSQNLLSVVKVWFRLHRNEGKLNSWQQ